MATESSRAPIEELKAILEAMNLFQRVGYKPIPLSQETQFPSAYIVVDATLNEGNGKQTTDGGEYNRFIYPTVMVNIDTGADPLAFLDVFDEVESAILKDSKFWNVVIDRDVLASKWDSGDATPKRQGEITLELFFRKCLI